MSPASSHFQMMTLKFSRSLLLAQKCQALPHRVCIRCQSARAMRQAKETKGPGSAGYVMLIIPAATFCLGTWQVQRRKWKLGLIEELERKTLAKPVSFPEDLEELKDLEYKKVTVRGSFDHSKELYILPRSPVETDEHRQSGLMSIGTQSGVHVITPFHLADRNLSILVNRGWVSRNKQNPETRLEGQVDGEVELTGVVRKTEKRQQFGIKNDPSHNRWFHRDVDALAEVAGTEPVFLDADIKSTVPGGPVGGQTRVTLRNEHLSYIITWYSLTAITAFMWFTKYLKK